MKVDSQVIVKAGPMRRIQRLMREGLSASSPSSNPIRAMLAKWTARFSAFTRRRFVQQSRGGGEWPPLAASTISQRRDGRTQKGQRRSVAILVNTGMLRDATELGSPGNVVRPIDGGVLYGIGAAPRPDGKATLGQIAVWNQKGAGRLPVRTILVQPDEPTKDGMKRDAEVAARQLADQAKDAT